MERAPRGVPLGRKSQAGGQAAVGGLIPGQVKDPARRDRSQKIGFGLFRCGLSL